MSEEVWSLDSITDEEKTISIMDSIDGKSGLWIKYPRSLEKDRTSDFVIIDRFQTVKLVYILKKWLNVWRKEDMNHIFKNIKGIDENVWPPSTTVPSFELSTHQTHISIKHEDITEMLKEDDIKIDVNTAKNLLTLMGELSEENWCVHPDEIEQVEGIEKLEKKINLRSG